MITSSQLVFDHATTVLFLDFFMKTLDLSLYICNLTDITVDVKQEYA